MLSIQKVQFIFNMTKVFSNVRLLNLVLLVLSVLGASVTLVYVFSNFDNFLILFLTLICITIYFLILLTVVFRSGNLNKTTRLLDVERDKQRVEIDYLNHELKLSKHSENLMFDFLPQLVWKAESNGTANYYNLRWDDFIGDEFRKAEGEKWIAFVHPDDVEATQNTWDQCVASGEKYQTKYRLRRHDGTYKWFLARGIPVKDENGAIIQWFGTCTDIEEQISKSQDLEMHVNQRTQELKLLNERLQKSNKDLEQFAYVASHDLQEPLRKIQAFTERLLKKYRSLMPEQGQEYMDRMQKASKRMQNLINDLLIYSRVSTKQVAYTPVDLNNLMMNVIDDLEVAIKESRASIQIEQLPSIKGNEAQLSQLFQNLIKNSIKFSKDNEDPNIHIYVDQQPEKDEQLAHYHKYDGKYTVIHVKDNGIGFDTQYINKIFNIFQRLHGRNEYEGTGIGLAVCRRVVENHGGRITADSQFGLGSVFKIILPDDKNETV